jgi:hypothetical protein
MPAGRLPARARGARAGGSCAGPAAMNHNPGSARPQAPPARPRPRIRHTPLCMHWHLERMQPGGRRHTRRVPLCRLRPRPHAKTVPGPALRCPNPGPSAAPALAAPAAAGGGRGPGANRPARGRRACPARPAPNTCRPCLALLHPCIHRGAWRRLRRARRHAAAPAQGSVPTPRVPCAPRAPLPPMAPQSARVSTPPHSPFFASNTSPRPLAANKPPARAARPPTAIGGPSGFLARRRRAAAAPRRAAPWARRGRGRRPRRAVFGPRGRRAGGLPPPCPLFKPRPSCRRLCIRPSLGARAPLAPAAGAHAAGPR